MSQGKYLTVSRLTPRLSGLTPEEYATLQKLSTPDQIQTFLDALPMNFEKEGDTHRSPRAVLREKKAHCIEGALLAATAFWIHGEPPLILDLSTIPRSGDDDHVIALYKRNGYFGAVSKTNHAVLRFRDPIYRTLRELALSYFHEWFLLSTGRKTLDRYSKQLDLRRFGTDWITTEENLWEVADTLDALPHYKLVPKGNGRYVRKASEIEIRAGSIAEWSKDDAKT